MAASVCVIATGDTACGQSTRLGTINFPTAGSETAQPHFIRGVLFLHSFEYDSAAAEFVKAQHADPKFAMAYWGEAMTYTHPVWNEQDTVAARKALRKLAPSAAVRRATTSTPREAAYLNAVELLYGTGTKVHRDTVYSAAMGSLSAQYPSDAEAKTFYALSLLGLNQGVRDVPTYMKAGAIAEEVFGKYPDHPGAAHYVIHSYDDPRHAPMGLKAARAYSTIARGAAHAQHMTTHIFMALGMWDDVASQNEIASGHDHGMWTPGHYTLWLNYAYLQQGRYDKALHLLETLRTSRGAKTERPIWIFKGQYLIDTDQWNGEVAKWDSGAVPENPAIKPYWDFIRGYESIKLGDEEGASRALIQMTRDNSATGPETNPTNAILELELKAMVKVAQGASDGAVALMRSATAREDAMPFDFGPPPVVKPSHELFGEMLLQLNQPKEAAAEFQRAIARAPRRVRSLLGLARAAKANGDADTSRQTYGEIRTIWHLAEPAQSGLAELK
ncbi:MAG: tetratricopeptide repeat protein [Gemmatimonadaceae bacterium]